MCFLGLDLPHRKERLPTFHTVFCIAVKHLDEGRDLGWDVSVAARGSHFILLLSMYDPITTPRSRLTIHTLQLAGRAQRRLGRCGVSQTGVPSHIETLRLCRVPELAWAWAGLGLGRRQSSSYAGSNWYPYYGCRN